MFADDIRLVAYALDRYAVPDGMCIDIGGACSVTVSDYDVTIKLLAAGPGLMDPQRSRLTQTRWPLREAFRLGPEDAYEVEDPAHGGVPMSRLAAKHGRKFAVAACLNVLEHTRRPWDDARAMAGCMVSGGLMVVSVPWIFPDHPSPEDNYRFSPVALAELFDEREWTMLEHGHRLRVPLSAGIRCTRTGEPQAITTSYLIARAK